MNVYKERQIFFLIIDGLRCHHKKTLLTLKSSQLKLYSFKQMHQGWTEDCASSIESLIQNSQDPQKIITLFYTTFKTIKKDKNLTERNTLLANSCFPLSQCYSQTKCTYSNQYCKLQELFNAFVEKNRKQSGGLDKVNSHMLKLTTEMIADINEKKMGVIYQSTGPEEGDGTGNRLQRARSMSLFDKFEHLFSNDKTDPNEKSSRVSEMSQHLITERSQNKEIIDAILENTKMQKVTPRTTGSSSNQESKRQRVDSPTPAQPTTDNPLHITPPLKHTQSTTFLTPTIANILTLYEQHKIDRAHQLLTTLQTTSPSTITQYTSTNPAPNALTKLKHQYLQMLDHYRNFDLTDYKLDKKEDNITMYYKIIEKENLVAIQVESEVDITIEKFLCIASEIELYDKYVPFNYETLCLRNVARNTKIGRSKVFIPLLNNRQAYFQAKAYDRLGQENCIFMFSKNLKRDQLSQLSIEYKSQGLIDLDYIFFLLSYTPIDKQRGKVRMATCVDLKISILPKFILNKTARIFAFDYFKNIISINKKFGGSPWEKAIENKPEHYRFFREKVEEYFGSGEGKQVEEGKNEKQQGKQQQ